MQWLYNNTLLSEIPENAYAFVYEITNNLTGQKYIGKKFFYSKKTLKPLKGKTRKRHVVKESDWKTYTSSSKPVNADIEEIGIDNFTFEILSLHPNKTEANYAELRFHVLLDVLDATDENGNRKYYNLNIDRIYYPSVDHRESRIALFESLTK